MTNNKYPNSPWLRQAMLCLALVLVLTLTLTNTAEAQATNPDNSPPTANQQKAYLPIVQSPKLEQVMIGIYPPSWWTPNITDTIKNLMQPLDTWQGKKSSLAGVFHSFDQPNTVTNMLPYLWDSGYVPFVNLFLDANCADIANRNYDNTIRLWATNYKTYAKDGTRMAFLAPLQEMNGYWVKYGRDPACYINVYKHIQDIFNQVGVPRQSVRWVFAPNGYSNPGDPPFESYYPGNDYVDIVAFSSYNFGYNPSNPYPGWTSPQDVFQPYIDRLVVMAPTKPIFVAQTGTSGYGVSTATKNQWLKDTYGLLASNSHVKGVLYYNANSDYDWAFYLPPSNIFTGYRDGIASNKYVYVSPVEIFSFIPKTTIP